jgi:hypothetical protein
MARLFWFLVMVAFVAALLAGASWALAYSSVDTMLGAPPPEMGTQSTTFLWDGLPHAPGRPRVWRFAYSPTLIPGAPSVRIYVSTTGRVVQTEPANLPELLNAFRRRGY